MTLEHELLKEKRVQEVCVCAESCPSFCDTMDCSPPGSSVHGLLQARILEWAAISYSRGIFTTQGSNLHLLLGRQILYHLSYREFPSCLVQPKKKKKVLKSSANFRTDKFMKGD